MPNYLQIACQTPPDDAEAVGDLLTEAGALAVTFTDAKDQPLYEPPPGALTLWDAVVITAIFSEDNDVDMLLGQLQQRLSDFQVEGLKAMALPDQDWTRVWLKDFKPMQFGQRLWICPSGYDLDPLDKVIIDLDPGLAFGTGTHPTTALCLAWLDGQDVKDKHVIDYGCGSGILGIAALKLGAAHMVGVDLDPQALIATIDNAERNQINNGQLETFLPQDLPAMQTDILLANILANPLKSLVSHFTTLLKPGGKLILSGILKEQADEVVAAYVPYFKFVDKTIEGDWVRLEWYAL